MENFRIVDPILPEPRKFLKYYEMSQKERHYSNGGPCVKLLEKRFEDILNCHIVTCNNATSGLTAAIWKFKQRDRMTVAMSDFTYAATACAITSAGCDILTYDINDEYALDLNTWSMNKPPAIIVITCPFGSIPFETIKKAKKTDSVIIVDAAASLGLPWKDLKRLVGMVDAVVFSLHATKTFGIGEGGLVACKDASTAVYIKDFMSFCLSARSGGNRYVHDGMNGKMPELMAAVALAKLDSFEEDNNRRIEKAMDFIVDIAVEGMELYPFEHTYQVLPFIVKNNHLLKKALNLYRIPFRQYYEAPLGKFEHPQAQSAHRYNMCLPFSERMTAKQISEIKRVLRIFEYMQEKQDETSLHTH